MCALGVIGVGTLATGTLPLCATACSKWALWFIGVVVVSAAVARVVVTNVLAAHVVVTVVVVAEAHADGWVTIGDTDDDTTTCT